MQDFKYLPRSTKSMFKGCMTAMITPFDQKEQVDYDGLEEITKFQIKNGISGLVPLGTTGESPTITEEERKQIIKFVIDEAGKTPVIPGTGNNSTEKTIKQSKEAEKLGADAVLIVSPYYNKPSQEGLFKHFKAVDDAINIPIIIYNIQSRTGVNIETPTLARMAKLKNIAGVKEASGSMAQMMDVINQLPEDFTVLSGDDNMTLPLIAVGGRGVISVVSNLFPKLVSDMTNYALKGENEKARKLNYKLLPIFKAAFIETNPAPIKTAMRWAGMPAGHCRLPLCNMLPENEEKLKNVLKKYQEIKLTA